MKKKRTDSGNVVTLPRELLPAFRRLEQSLDRIDHYVRKQLDWRMVMLRSALGGMVSVLGALVTIAIIVPIVIWFLRGVQWPPVVDAVVNRVLERVEEQQEQRR